MPSRRVLVVGAGFLGSHIARRLVASDREVRVLTTSPPRSALPDCHVVVGDAADRSRAAEALLGCQVVVWCAGQLLPLSTHEELSELDDISPLHEVLCELAIQGGRRFVYLSSGGTVYGNATTVPTSEAEPLRPISIYGATRVRCERYVQELGRRHDIRTTILRCGNVYGPGQRAERSQGVVAHALACQRSGHPLSLRADLGSIRDYIYVEDVVDVVEASLTSEPPDTMNVATGIGTQLGDLLAMIHDLTGGPEVIRAPEPPEDVHTSILDITRLRQFLPGYHPQSLARGLELTCREREPLLLE